MSRRLDLTHLLAEIELDRREADLDKRQGELDADKRKLGLDRKKLEYQDQLTKLNMVDLTEDEDQTKTESSINGVKETNRTTNPTAKETLLTTTTDSATVEEDASEQNITIALLPSLIQAAVRSDNNHTTANEEEGPNGEYAPKQAKTMMPQVPSSSPLSSPPGESSTDEQALQTKFMQSPAPQVGHKEQPNGRKRAYPLGSDNSGAASNASGQESEAIESNPDQSSKSKRRRSTRGDNKSEEQNSDDITPDEGYDLIKRYTGLFLTHMGNVERQLPNFVVNTTSVASKVRNVGPRQNLWHTSITGLHNEFKDSAVDPRTNTPVRYALEAELLKFEEALPYWSPKCKGLSRQQDRLSMVNKVMQHIIGGNFNKDDYREAYDPHNEL